jgi:long-chain fatty acid transport protein
MTVRKFFKSFSFLSLMAASALHATNGDQMIATGTKSMGMGGVSVAMPFGAESGLANPALITYVEHSEISGSATLFFPDIKTKTNRDNTFHKSDSNFYLMPAVQYATHLGGKAYAGLGVWGVAGMGVDFSDAPSGPLNGSGLLQMKDDLMIMHIAAPLALKEGGMSIGIAPILQVGMLDIEMLGSKVIDKDWEANPGAVIGLAYDFDNGLIVGAKYRTPISMDYDMKSGGSLSLQQPGELGVGFSYTYGPHTLAFDYKRIQWGSADGYSDFGWRSQDIYAVGYQYQTENWALRFGYNHGKSPIPTGSTETLEDYFNLLGFPATSKDHYTIGGTYTIDKEFSLDLAAVYSPKVTTSGKLVGKNPNSAINEFITNKHSEFSLTAQLNYKF